MILSVSALWKTYKHSMRSLQRHQQQSSGTKVLFSHSETGHLKLVECMVVMDFLTQQTKKEKLVIFMETPNHS